MSDTTTTAMQLERFQARRDTSPGAERSSSMPPCCGTGCAVCVLDYWEPDEFELPRSSKSETLAMLEAIEQAQWQAQRMIAEQDGDSQ
ncbi:MAG: hypothetical protein ACREA2_02235 [Blastocatellia bacterium]